MAILTEHGGQRNLLLHFKTCFEADCRRAGEVNACIESTGNGVKALAADAGADDGKAE